jgi:hypothetical protein
MLNLLYYLFHHVSTGFNLHWSFRPDENDLVISAFRFGNRLHLQNLFGSLGSDTNYPGYGNVYGDAALASSYSSHTQLDRFFAVGNYFNNGKHVAGLPTPIPFGLCLSPRKIRERMALANSTGTNYPYACAGCFKNKQVQPN